MGMRKKWLSLFLCAAMFMSLILASESQAAPEETSYPKDSLAVTVVAEDKQGEEVPVEDAVVTVSVGDQVAATGISDADGVAIVSLEGLSKEDLLNATVEAYKTVDRGKGISGSARDDLFEYFPKDENGDYYRYEYQLRSETLDSDGNWLGQELPFSTGNRVDVAFLIDATGSMEDKMELVKENLEYYMERMADYDYNLDIRYSVIEYRDTTYHEMPVRYELDGSHWFTDKDAVNQILSEIVAEGGGDAISEGIGDALKHELLDDEMGFRNDAYRFAFILTDAGYYHQETRGGGTIWIENVSEDLRKKNIKVSVITPEELWKEYEEIVEATGGTYADLDWYDYYWDMYDITIDPILSKTAEMKLKLSEPRLLVNMSVCYLADDTVSQSSSYLDSMKKLLSIYSQEMAQSTDGHVFLDKVILFPTDSLMDFFTLSERACMADIQIHSREADGARIRANAFVNGFYSTSTVSGQENLNYFTGLQNVNDYKGRNVYQRIQMSGTEGAGWNNSFIEEPEAYASTLMHETGHYLLGYRDEYLDASGNDWDIAKKPYAYFGLMDNQHSDIELSKAGIDYHYLGEFYHDDAPLTRQYNTYHLSCEDMLAYRLERGNNYNHVDQASTPSLDIFTSPYRAKYTLTPMYNSDRKAEYSYAALTDDDYILLDNEGNVISDAPAAVNTGLPFIPVNGTIPAWYEELPQANIIDSVIGSLNPGAEKDTFTMTVAEEEGSTYSLYVRKQGEKQYSRIDLEEEEGGYLSAELPIGEGELAEILIAKESGGTILCNTWFVDHSEPAEGYVYTSPDGKVAAYGTGGEETSYTFIADNTSYENGEFTSLNQATHVYVDGKITGGEIYSAASCRADLDYSSVCWFKYDGEKWIPLPTDCTSDENGNIGARADLDGEGLYVLMGRKAAAGTAETPDFLIYTPSETVDASVTLSFDDFNENSKYYYVYYSTDPELDPTEDPLAMMLVYEADKCEWTSETGRSLILNLPETGQMYHVAVQTVLEDGSRSKTASLLVKTFEADRDGDGIPDRYLDKYKLWLDDPEAIAGADPDGDGLTNLEEYLGGTDPTVPDNIKAEETEDPWNMLQWLLELLRRQR